MPDAPVAVVGGGPAGLSAAIELRRRGVGEVMVIERESVAGGIPRHAGHQGFGLRDLRRPLSGPAYARRYVELARAAGVDVLTETMATGWTDGAPGALELTSPRGRSALEPAAVVLATGCRERPRSARLVPGSRPAGVMTTGMLQQLVYLHGRPVGRDAVIVGAEHVSFSAVLTLAHAGARARALITEFPRHQTLGAFRLGARARYGVPLWTRTRLSEIRGRERVEEVEVTDLCSGRARSVACDTVVFSADWVPDHELAVVAGIELDELTRGPAVDPGLHSSRPGVFAAGNLLHGAEQADFAALSGRHVAASVIAYLSEGSWPSHRLPVICESPLGWIAPNVLTGPGSPPPARGHFALRAFSHLRAPRIEVMQDERVLWSGRLPRVMPGRSTRLPASWVAAAAAAGGPVVVRLSFAKDG
jgi:thioredoxin reductase